MAEIMNRNGVSVQVFRVTQAAVAGGGSLTQTITLDRAGVFLGGSVTGGGLSNINHNGAQMQLTTGIGNPLTYGAAISQIQVSLRNNAGAPQDLECHVVLYIGI